MLYLDSKMKNCCGYNIIIFLSILYIIDKKVSYTIFSTLYGLFINSASYIVYCSIVYYSDILSIHLLDKKL